MTRHAHVDPSGGLAGDMVLAALVDAGRRVGVDVSGAIAEAVRSADIDCTISFVDDVRASLGCVRTVVEGGDVHLGIDGIRTAITGSGVSDAVRTAALRSLQSIIDAESAVHRTTDVHLHEVGTADTVVDLLGAAVGFEALGIDTLTCGPVPMPHGWVRSGHGLIPLPAPAVVEMLKGATVVGSDEDSELVTPSGLAVLVGHNVTFSPSPAMTLTTVGCGGGTRDRVRPNICRLLVGERSSDGMRLETVVVLEANIDDQTPESLGFAITALLEAGAADAWVTPIVMKKSRSAFALSVIVAAADESVVTQTLFRTTSTIGVRRRTQERHVLDRRIVKITLESGQTVAVKIATLGDDDITFAPEFDDCASAASQTGRSLQDIYTEAAYLARKEKR